MSAVRLQLNLSSSSNRFLLLIVRISILQLLWFFQCEHLPGLAIVLPPKNPVLISIISEDRHVYVVKQSCHAVRGPATFFSSIKFLATLMQQLPILVS